MQDVASSHGLLPLIRFRTTLLRAIWDEERALWRAQTDRGEILTRAIVSGAGGLHHPKMPDIPGQEDFGGVAFHTATWDHSVDLKGRRVGVIGTGASAIQVVPELAEIAGQLTLFQRTPPWIMPKNDRAIPEERKARYARWPLLRWLERMRLFWRLEFPALVGFTRVSKVTAQAEGMARHHLRKAVPDKALRAKLTPNYRFGCKRVLLSDDYYPALQRENVTLETGAIDRIVPDGVRMADGTHHRLDALVYATGFDVTGGFLQTEVVGRGGLRLAEAWADGMQAFQGITVAGFPNYFIMLGPNTGIGHNSIIAMIEIQASHILGCLRALGQGKRVIEVREPAQTRFVERIRNRMKASIWQAGGCRSWYLDARGRNTTLWPDSVLAYRRSAKRARMADYRVE